MRIAIRGAVGALLLLLNGLGPTQAAGLDELFQDAEAQARRGDGAALEQTYESILQQDPDNVRALVGRATARSWQGRYGEAQTDYRRALAQQPGHLEALTGLGYSLAWDGQFEAAATAFQRARQLAPDNLGARKGLAFTALWSGRLEQAQSAFDELAREYPDDPEIAEARGQIALQQWRPGTAASAFQQALDIEPERASAAQGLRAAHGAPGRAELSVWVGNTSGEGDAGLRQAQLAVQATPQTRAWLRYDDTLSLDNPALARSGDEAKAGFLGLLQRIVPGTWLSAEAGYRDLPDGDHQQIYKLEGIQYWAGSRSVKAGLQLSPHSDDFTDKLVFAGLGLPMAERFRLDPTVFFARTGAAGDDEWRGVVHGEYTDPDGWSLGLDLGGGHIDSAVPGASGGVWVAAAQWNIPVAGWHRLHLSAYRETNPSDSFWIAMVGFTLKLPRN